MTGLHDPDDDTPAGPEIDAATARAWQLAGEAVLIDVREPFEYEYENIPGAALVSLSFLDPTRFPAMKGTRLVVFCAIGRRGATAQRRLIEAGWPEVYNMQYGIEGWIGAGLETSGKGEESGDYSI